MGPEYLDRPALIGVPGLLDNHTAFLCPPKDGQGLVRVPAPGDSRPDQRIGFADHFPDGYKSATLLCTLLNAIYGSAVMDVSVVEETHDRAGVEDDGPHRLHRPRCAVKGVVNLLRELRRTAFDRSGEGKCPGELLGGVGQRPDGLDDQRAL